MTASLYAFPRNAESERNAILERDNAWLEARLVEPPRADKAERRLRARLVELTWPATLGAIAGGFVAVLALRWWWL
jgi:hypothetical protein